MRKENSTKNFFSGIIPYFILAILGFVRIDIFMKYLGVEVFALNQLFFQLFAYISLIEAGVGSLIVQLYYRLLVKNDTSQINRIFTASKKLLRKISIIIIIIGVAISFGLKMLTNNNMSLLFMQLVFILFILKCVIDYLMFSPRFVLQADQKIYKINFKISMYRIIEILIEIILLYLYGNYILILISAIVIRILGNLHINKKIYKEYPWLNEVPNDEIVPIKGMKYIIGHKIAGAVYNNTDILVISAFLSPLKVAIYSSYNYIIKFITDAVYIFASSITASFGNVMYKENQQDQRTIFEEMNALFLFMAMFFTIVIFHVTDSFITLWIGQDKIMTEMGFILMVSILFFGIMRRPLLIMRDTKGLFKETQIMAIIEASINVGLSIILIQKFDLVGVLLATIIASVLTSFWYLPNYVYHHIFKASVFSYYMKQFVVILLTILICYGSAYLYPMQNINNLLIWFIYCCIYSIILLIILIGINYCLFGYFRRTCYKAFSILRKALKGDGKNAQNIS
jgi:O-antigen/teichoic acid export membrane protein